MDAVFAHLYYDYDLCCLAIVTRRCTGIITRWVFIYSMLHVHFYKSNPQITIIWPFSELLTFTRYYCHYILKATL